MKGKKIKINTKKAVGLSMAVAMSLTGMPQYALYPFDKIPVVKAADSTVTVDSNAVVQQIDSKETNRPGIPDGTLLNELKKVVNTSLGREADHDITFAELMSYSGEIDLSTVGSQITSISGLGYARKASKIILTNVSMTAIEDYEFDNCKGLQEIVLPTGLTQIGKFAFRNCNKLTKITLPDTVTAIDESAFDACTALEEINIPSGVSLIGKGAFGGCTGLKKMEIPNGTVELGASVFEGCTNLQTLHLPEGIKKIPASFCAYSGIRNITLPTTITEIGQSAFLGTSGLQQIDLSKCNNLTVIGNNAFAASGITSATLPTSLKLIKSNAFEASAIKEISIPDSVMGSGDGAEEGGVEKNAFWNCKNLTKVSLSKGISVLQEGIFKGCTSLTQVEMRDKENSILTSIEQEAFMGCNNLSDTDFLKGLTKLTKIKKNAFTYVLPEKYDEKDIYGNLDLSNGLRSITVPDCVTEIEAHAFDSQVGVKNIQLGKGIITIPESLFEGFTNLRHVTLPSQLQEIGDSAFEGCMQLAAITFPDTLQKIGKSAFEGCSAVNDIQNVAYHVRYVENSKIYDERPAGNTTAMECLVYTEDEAGKPKIEEKAAEYASMLTESEYKEKGSPQGYKKLYIIAEKRYAKPEEVAYREEKVSDDEQEYTAYTYDKEQGTISNVQKVISSSDNLKSGVSVTPKEGYVGYYVRQSIYNMLSLRNYTGLKEIQLPNSITEIGDRAFANCYNVKNITLSNQLKELPENAFSISKREKLNQTDWLKDGEVRKEKYVNERKVTLPETIQSIGNSAFKNNANMTLTKETLPRELLSIGDSAFEECRSLSEICISSKVKSIGERAFYACCEYTKLDEQSHGYDVYRPNAEKGLKDIDLGQASALESIGKYAFGLTVIKQCSIPNSVTTINQGIFQDCHYLQKVVCSDKTNAIKADVFGNCASLVSITIPAQATISRNAFRGYQIGDFSFSVTDPEPVSVSVGEVQALSTNTFLADYLRNEMKVTEKDGVTGYIEMEPATTETINAWNIYKANVKGVKEGTTRVSMEGTINFSLYDDVVIPKAPEVTVTVTVTKKKCTAIEDTNSNIVLGAETKQVELKPKVLPEDCSEANVWTSGNSSVAQVEPYTYLKDGVATVSSSAIVVPKGLGTTKVVLKCGSVKKEYQVNVVVPANGITLDSKQISLKEDSGKSVKLVPTLTYDAGKYTQEQWNNYKDIVTFKSDDTKIAKVSEDGVVEPVAAGVTTIHATTLGSGVSTTCQVVVTADETMVYFVDENGTAIDKNTPLTVQAGEEFTMRFATNPSDSLDAIQYEFGGEAAFKFVKADTRPVKTEDAGTKNKTVAMTFVANKIGKGSISLLPEKYKNKENVMATRQIQVVADTKEVVFAPVSKMHVGESQSLFGYATSSVGKAEKIEDVNKITTDTIYFTSSDVTKATIDSKTGVITALKDGKVTVYMHIDNATDPKKNQVKSLEVEISYPAASKIVVKGENNKSVVQVGEKLKLNTSLIPAEAVEKVTFTSLTPQIATVDENGLVTGLKAGTAQIKATTSESQVSAIVEITVTKKSSKPGVVRLTIAKVKGLKVTNVKGKSVKVTWKKAKNISGYHILLATNSKFTKNKKNVIVSSKAVSKKISGLKKGKTYYVKIQAYKTYKGKKVYGKYCAAKKVKIKK